MLDLNDVALFVEVVRHGSFAAAARHLGVPSNTLSRRVQQLEEKIGTRLMQRSTRKLALTSAGEAFYERCADQVDGLLDASRELMSGSREAGGLVRVAAPADFFDFFLMRWVDEFLVKHPHVRFDFVLSDAKTDLISERIDVAFRGGLLEDSGYVGRQVLSPGNNRLAASPKYLSMHGVPATLQELTQHHCVSFPHASGYATWRLSTLEGGQEEVKVPIRVSGNTAQSLRKAASEGLGIALLPRTVARLDLEAGLLVLILPQYQSNGYGLNVLYPSRKHLPLAVSEFIDLVIEKLSFLEQPLKFVKDDQTK